MKPFVTLLLLMLGGLHPLFASFHLWDIDEVYSNADGTVQFVRLSTKSDGQEFLAGQSLTFTGPGGPHTFTFPTNAASGSTANHSLLIGTSSLQTLYGITPDYVIPASFFAQGPGANLDFAGVDSVSLAKLPLDGVKSLNGRAGDDPPTHFAINANAKAINFAGNRFTIGAFGAYGGKYSGVLVQASFVPAESGFLSVTLAPTGAFSGKLKFGTQSFTVAGKFDGLGNSSVNLANGAIALALKLDLLNGTDQIAATLTRTALATLNWTLDRGVVVPKGGAAAKAGSYTFLMPPAVASPAPQGVGFASVNVAKNGVIKAIVTLADGTHCTQSVPISKNGVWPFYASLYGTKGLILGALNFRPVEYVSDADGGISWFRPANPKAKTFAPGFTEHLTMIGSKYQAPLKGSPALQFGAAAGGPNVTISPAPLLTKAVTLSATNKITVAAPGADKLAMIVSAPKGTFTGSFVETAVNKKRTFSGVLFQKQALAAGFFLNTNEGGFVALSVTPTASNPSDIKNGTVAAGTKVTLSNVLVTGIGVDGFFAQRKDGDAGFTGADYSGLFALAGSELLSTIAVGNRVSFAGVATVLDGTPAITALSGLDVINAAEAPPLPVAVTAAEIAFGGVRATALDAVLVQIDAASVSAVNAGENEFTVNDAAGSLIVGNYLFTANPLPGVGTAYTRVTGILALRGGVSRILPRSAGDLPVAIPVLSTFGPQPAFVTTGSNGQPTIPSPLSVTITSPAVGDTFISIGSSNSGVLTVSGGGVTIPASQSSAPVLVNGLAEGSVTLTASLGGSMLTADVRVFNENTPPTLQSFTPASDTIGINDTKQFTVTLDRPAPVGGTVVTLGATPQNLGSLPPTVTVPQGQISASFIYTSGASEGGVALSATLGATTLPSSLTIQSNSGHLVINEVDYDQVGLDTAEFVEIYNASSGAVNLSNVALVLVNGSSNAEYRRVDLSDAGSIPAHGYLVICNSGLVIASGAIRYSPPPGIWPTTDAIQNGAPDGVLLLDKSTNTVIDRLSYEGSITAAMITGVAGTVNLVEGTAIPSDRADSNTATASLCRLPNGNDTDDATTDWTLSNTPTPGSPNMQ